MQVLLSSFEMIDSGDGVGWADEVVVASIIISSAAGDVHSDSS
jgi:hypothetical protein